MRAVRADRELELKQEFVALDTIDGRSRSWCGGTAPRTWLNSLGQ